MKHRLLRIFILVLTTAFAVSSQPLPAAGGGPLPAPLPDKPTPQERQIENRDRKVKGIVIDELKVYDDALLQRMLEETESRLAQLRLLDSGKILERLGAVTGAEQSISSFGLNVQGPSLPGVVTKTTATGTEETVTVPQANPPTATAPAPTTAMPTSFNVSSSNILNEQMQLSFEVANLRLLVGGSLSDYFVTEDRFSQIKYVKLKTTLGFTITITPDDRYKGAVAIVEVEVEKLSHVGQDEPPAITNLLPKEKTYNVASITDKSTSIQGGVVTQVAGVGGSWLRGRKTHYLVQDQDTLALSYQPEDPKKVGFMWQFRPVLGRDFVIAGKKNTFVQIAFPAPPGAKKGEIGKIHIRTYWRKYDRKKGIVKEIIPNSLKEITPDFDIPRYELTQPTLFDASSLEDIGNGQILVRLRGRFLPGTFVRIGGSQPAFTMDYTGIRFAASAADLATKKVALVSHDGTEVELQIEHTSLPTNLNATGPPPPRSSPQIVGHQVTTVDDANSIVTVKLADRVHITQDKPPLVMVIGGRVFGYSDAPIKRDETEQTLSAVVPTSLLIANPEVIVRPLFAPERFNPPYNHYEDREKLTAFDVMSRNERLIPIEQEKDKIKFLLQGNRLKDITILVPKLGKPDYIGRAADYDTMRTVTLSLAEIKAHKFLVLQRKDERPFLVSIPSIEIKPPKAPEVKERVTVNADEAVIEGDGMDGLTGVKYKDRSIPFTVAKDGNSATLTGLRLLGVTEVAMTRTLDLQFKEGKATVKLEIVNSKVEQVTK